LRSSRVPPQPLPRLSQTLPERVEPGVCQACGEEKNVCGWQEHDERDKPEAIVVWLCQACEKKLIKPHPRLYRPLQANEPFPA